jgi:alpha-tubulin suppressor-like RCC1 family protein
LAGATALYISASTVHADAPNAVGNIKNAAKVAEETTVRTAPLEAMDWLSISTDPENTNLVSLAWGSNKGKTLLPGTKADSFGLPVNVEWLKDVALRDLALQEKHAACVDSRGDVYQWGSDFSLDKPQPALTLRGKDITSLTATPTRIFALSSSGHVYALSSRASKQTLGSPHSASSSGWFGGLFGGERNTIDFVELSAPLTRGEKIVQLSAGTHHLLALTSSGRALSLALSSRANSHGQLGTRKVPGAAAGEELELVPDSILREQNPELRSAPAMVVRSPGSPKPSKPVVEDDVRFANAALQEIPALRGIKIAQLTAGARSSLARTGDGRVLAWGANEFGQLGLGGTMTVGTITRPTEVVLAGAGLPAGSRMICTDIAAAGDLTLFTVERRTDFGTAGVDILACGNGQFGGLGSAVYSTAQGTPLRVKNISGLLEYSEKTKSLQPLRPVSVAPSSTGHVLCTLDTLSHAQTSLAGRDLYVWGANNSGELGNGRRASSALPATVDNASGQRFMLTSRTAKEVRDLRGKVWKRGVRVEQCAVTGPGCSAVYWRIC